MSNTDHLRLRDYTADEEINLSSMVAKVHLNDILKGSKIMTPDRRERIDFISNQKRKSSPGYVILRDVSKKRGDSKYNQI
jgi:hypothetical protein